MTIPAASDQPELRTPAAGRRVLMSNIGWMLLGNLSNGFSQWALLVVLAKVGTLDMVGEFALAQAIALPVLMFSSLSLRSLQVTDYARVYRFLDYAALRAVCVVLSIAFIACFGLVTGQGFQAVAATTLIGTAKSMEYISDILYGSMQGLEEMAGIAISMTARATLSVVSLSVAVWLTHSLLAGAVALFVSSALVLAVYDVPKTLSVARKRWEAARRESAAYWLEFASSAGPARLRRLALSGLPMGFVMMMVSLNLNIPRYFIKHSLGLGELGIFSAIATLLAAGSVVTNAVGQAAAPRLAKYFATGNRAGFVSLLGAIVLASLGLGALGFSGALLFGREAMALIYRPEYSTRQDVLVWLMGASGFFYLGSTLGYAVTAVRCFTPQLPLFAVAAGVTAACCAVLVPSQGLKGAAIAILISAAIQCAGSAMLLARSFSAADRIVATAEATAA